MSDDETLTGLRRFRARVRWFGPAQLVLQVQVHYSGMDLVGGYPDRVDYTYWRDARVQDLTLEDQLADQSGTLAAAKR